MSERSPQETAAHQYADTGWPVFPCRPGSKEPATEHGFQDASTSHGQIGRWWSADPDRNVAIPTGAPGPDVLDVDRHENGSGFAALNMLKRQGLVDGYHAVVQTPSRGMHLYYAGTDQRNGSIRGQHLDFRSRGGYVVAPPSRTELGAYVVEKHEPPAGVTVNWAAIRTALEPPQPERTPRRDRQADPGEADTSLDRLVEWTARRAEHDRNFPLFWAAKQAALAGLLDGAAEERFVDAARRNGMRGGEREARRSIESARRAAQRESAPQAIHPRHGSHQAAARPFAEAPQPQLQAGAEVTSRPGETWHYREQDRHPEIRLEPVVTLIRRTEFARLRGEGYCRGAVRDMLAMDDLTAYRYEARRLRHVAAYEELCSRPAWPGQTSGRKVQTEAGQ